MAASATSAQLDKAELPAMTDRQLAEYVRGKLNLALSLACQGEQERRSCHWASAEAYQRQWEEVMAEVKRLLPLVRKSGISLFASKRAQSPRSGDGGG
jgi:hypothetical protein